MKKLKKLKTHKLFYGVYPYKLVWRTELASQFRGGLIGIRKTLDGLQNQYSETKKVRIPVWYNRVITVQGKDLHDAQKVFTALTNLKDYRIRVEQKDVTIFTRDKDWAVELINSIDHVLEWWEPEAKLVPNTILMGPTMEGWEYKITLGSHIPDSFIRWYENNKSKVRMGESLRENLERFSPYLYGYYFYVRNEKMLNLVCLMLGSSIRRIDKIVIQDKNA